MNWKTLVSSISWKNIKRIVRQDVLDSEDGDWRAVFSIMLGAFMSVFPAWGFQGFISVCLSTLLKLSKVLTLTFTMISIPFIPLVLFGSYSIGCVLLKQPVIFQLAEMDKSMLGTVLIPYLLGAVVLSICMSVVFGTISFFSLKVIRWRMK